MINQPYNFKEQVAKEIQKQGTKLVANYWCSEGHNIIDVSEDKNYFNLGVDLIRQIDNEQETIDVKTDTKAHFTKNLLLELIEIAPKDIEKQIKLGWGYNKIDEIDFLVWETKELFILPLNKFKEFAFTAEILDRKGFASWHLEPYPYFTLGILIPITEIKKHFKFLTL